MTAKKTRTGIVKLEVIVAVIIQSICTEVSSEQQDVTSHTTVVFQLILIIHSQKRHALSIPPSLPVGYTNALEKLRRKKVHWTRTLQPVNTLSGRTPITVHSRTYWLKYPFHVIYKLLYVSERPMLQKIGIILSENYRLWRRLGSHIMYIVTAEWPGQFRVWTATAIYQPHCSDKILTLNVKTLFHSTCFLLAINELHSIRHPHTFTQLIKKLQVGCDILNIFTYRIID